jgi:hypothetical protein
MNLCLLMVVLSPVVLTAPPPAKVSEKPPPLPCDGGWSFAWMPRGTLPYSDAAVAYSGCALDGRFFHASYLRGEWDRWGRGGRGRVRQGLE